MNTDEIIIHLIRPADIPATDALRFLTETEIARAARFRFEKDANHWSACRAALRVHLAAALGISPRDVPIQESAYGKPLLSPPYNELHFNLSHCADLALLALSTSGPLGIDLEQTTRATELLECETSFCHPEEILALPGNKASRANMLLDIWTAKEAVLKALGTGLSHPPESVRIHGATACSDSPLPGLEKLTIQRLAYPELDGYQAALAAPSGKMIKLFYRPISPGKGD